MSRCSCCDVVMFVSQCCLLIYNQGRCLCFSRNRTLRASSPLSDTAINPMSAMSSSLWYKAGRSCISPMPTLISVQSVPDEDSAQQQESGYSSLHGYVDYERRCQSTQARSFCNTFDSCEGKPSYCLCFANETVPLGILFCYKRKWYDSFYFCYFQTMLRICSRNFHWKSISRILRNKRWEGLVWGVHGFW